VVQKSCDWSKKLAGLPQAAAQIMNVGDPNNYLIISNVGFSDGHQPTFTKGIAPLVWWPLGEKQKRDLILGRLAAFSLYNPSRFLTLLREHGYQISIDDQGRLVSAKNIYRTEEPLSFGISLTFKSSLRTIF
jgi:hypothetical protein